MRLRVFRPARHAPTPVRAGWVDLEARLADHPRRQLILTVCWAFAHERGSPDLATLRGLDPDAVAATWAALVRRMGWTERHARRMRQCLLVGLPAAGGGNVTTHVEASNSAERDFILEDCLPLVVRRLPPQHPRRLFLEHVAQEYIVHPRSLSRVHLRLVFALVHRLVADVEPPTALWPHCRALTALDWLDRYAALHQQRAGHTMCLTAFRRHMHILSVLHAKVFVGPDSRCTHIPAPRPGGVVHREGGGFATSGSSETDVERRHGQRRVLETMAALRRRLCAPPPTVEARTALEPDEVRRLLSTACIRTVERLVVWLLLTTGLRIGGLSRLRIDRPAAALPLLGRHVPSSASTVEKNGRNRTVLIGPTGRSGRRRRSAARLSRILVARWWRERPAADGGFLFPSPGHPGRPIGTRWVWSVCHTVFARARIDDAHPHSLRHTFVHLLHLTGYSFESIAKIIGHSSPATTANVYGRLPVADLESACQRMPWMASTPAAADRVAEWKSLCRWLAAPWTFPPEEWDGLLLLPPPASDRLERCKRSTRLARSGTRGY